MKLAQFHSEASKEFQEAAAWYDAQRVGLGDEFLVAVSAAIDRIVAHPLRWPAYTHRSRRYRLNRFPYAVVYHVLGDQIVIIAIPHAKRRPGYWRNRQPDAQRGDKS